MRFELSEDQKLLQGATAEFLAAESPIEVSRQISETDEHGFSAAHWKKLAELGYTGLLLPESVGGQGLGPVELAIVCAEMGKVCFPGPYLDVVLASQVLADAGGQDELLSKVATGEAIVVLATADSVWPGSPGDTRFTAGTLQGRKYFVPFAAAADCMLVITRQGLVLTEGPVDVEPMRTVDESRRFGEVTFDCPATAVADHKLVDGIAELAQIGAGALALGICESTMQAAVEYSKGRTTFGKPIGTYQVLQHRMADMLLRTESSRATVLRAAWALSQATDDAVLLAAAAKHYAVESANRITRDAVQIHGGNGFTWEYNLHRSLKLAMTLEQHYGPQDAMLERALDALPSV